MAGGPLPKPASASGSGRLLQQEEREQWAGVGSTGSGAV